MITEGGLSCFGKHIPNCEYPILFPKGWFTFKVFKEKVIFQLFVLNLINHSPIKTSQSFFNY